MIEELASKIYNSKFNKEKIELFHSLEIYFLECNDLCDQAVFAIMTYKLLSNERVRNAKKLILAGNLEEAKEELYAINDFIRHLRKDIFNNVVYGCESCNIQTLKEEIELYNKLGIYLVECNELCDRIVYAIITHRAICNEKARKVKKLILEGNLEEAKQILYKISDLMKNMESNFVKKIENYIYKLEH